MGRIRGWASGSGLVADRVLHIESAGMGHDIEGPSDLPDSQRTGDRYSMPVQAGWNDDGERIDIP